MDQHALPAPDEARLMPHLRTRHRFEERARLERKQRDVLQTEYARADADGVDTTKRGIPTAAGDARKLRGIPAVGRSVSGAIAGSSPHRDAPSLRDNDRAA